MRGRVKWFDPIKGFGFVTPDGGGRDVFLHIHALRRSNLATVKDGANVEFEIGPDQRGRRDQVMKLTVLAET